MTFELLGPFKPDETLLESKEYFVVNAQLMKFTFEVFLINYFGRFKLCKHKPNVGEK